MRTTLITFLALVAISCSCLVPEDPPPGDDDVADETETGTKPEAAKPSGDGDGDPQAAELACEEKLGKALEDLAACQETK